MAPRPSPRQRPHASSQPPPVCPWHAALVGGGGGVPDIGQADDADLEVVGGAPEEDTLGLGLLGRHGGVRGARGGGGGAGWQRCGSGGRRRSEVASSLAAPLRLASYVVDHTCR